MKVRLYSYVTFGTGYGKAGRELAHSLLYPYPNGPIQLEIRALGQPSNSLAPLGELDSMVLRGPWRLDNPDAVIVHAPPFECQRVLDAENLVKGQGPRLVAYTTWEGQGAPFALSSALAGFDQVWMPNAQGWTSMGNGVDLYRIPHSFEGYPHNPFRRTRTDETFRFYTIGAWQARKNMGGLIRAFAHTFTPADDVELIVQSSGADAVSFAATVATTGLKQSDIPKIRLSNEQVSDDAIQRLHANGDCFVTASRGEAWNLPAFDAMLSGRNVISPGGLGSDDYLAETSAMLYKSQLAPPMADVAAQSGDKGVSFTVNFQHGLDARQKWLEPNLDSLSRYMRDSFAIRHREIDLHYNPIERFGRQHVGELALKALEAL